MKAWRAHSFGPFSEVLSWEEVAAPTPPKGGVVLRVEAAALNFPDILSIAGQYQVKAPLPFTPGSEAAGEVIAVGEGSRFSLGDKVMTVGLWGAFAQQMAAPDMSCHLIPAGMSAAQAAAFTITHQTSYFGLVYRAGLRPGETLLVHGGAGGVGTTAIQIGKALGATVIATAGSAEKVAVCAACGADHVINHREEDFVPAVKKLTRGRGVDVVYDPVGGDVFHRSTKVIAFGGRVIVIGFASGDIPQIKANRILLKNMSVIGLFWGNYQLHQPSLIAETHDKLVDLFKQGKLNPVLSPPRPMSDLPGALKLLAERRSVGKVVVEASHEP